MCPIHKDMLNLPPKISYGRTTPSGRKIFGSETREREKTLLIEAARFCMQHPRAAHALHPDEKEFSLI
jgi:hypothetical protein